jgi:prevent-host-death family protein
MKVIPLSKAKARLSYYGRVCRKEPVIVTIKGVPSFKMVPVDDEDDDDLINRLLEHNPKFRALLEERTNEPTISVNEALRRLR